MCVEREKRRQTLKFPTHIFFRIFVVCLLVALELLPHNGMSANERIEKI